MPESFTDTSHEGFNSRLTGPVQAKTIGRWIKFTGARPHNMKLACATGVPFRHRAIMRYTPDIFRSNSDELSIPFVGGGGEVCRGDYVCWSETGGQHRTTVA